MRRGAGLSWPLFSVLVLGAAQLASGAAAPAGREGRPVPVRFPLEDVECVAAASRAWVSLVPNEGDFARLDHRQIRGARMTFRRASLESPVSEEASATAAYEAYLKGRGPMSFVKDARPPPVAVCGSFARCYLLSTGEKEPPRSVRCLMVVSNHLYDVGMEVPDRLAGPLRQEFYAMVGSFQVRALERPSPLPPKASPASGTPASATSPTP
jgi:hypothetical protein